MLDTPASAGIVADDQLLHPLGAARRRRQGPGRIELLDREGGEGLPNEVGGVDRQDELAGDTGELRGHRHVIGAAEAHAVALGAVIGRVEVEQCPRSVIPPQDVRRGQLLDRDGLEAPAERAQLGAQSGQLHPRGLVAPHAERHLQNRR